MRFPRNHQLETSRCMLRHVSEDDIPHVFSASRAKGFNDGMQWEPPRDQSELVTPHENNKKAWEDDSAYVFTIETRSGDFVGRIAIRSSGSADIWNLGFWTHPTYQGLGYMSEAVERILIFGFRELGAREVEACHATWNIASRRVLEKCGFSWREHIPKGFQKKGHWVSEECLSRTDDAEKVGIVQPTTCSDLESEGRDKPKPKSEGHSR